MNILSTIKKMKPSYTEFDALKCIAVTYIPIHILFNAD